MNKLRTTIHRQEAESTESTGVSAISRSPDQSPDATRNARVPSGVPGSASQMAAPALGAHNSGVTDDSVGVAAMATPTQVGTGVDDPANLGLAVAAVAQRLGLAPATLRTWDRRYGLGPSGRSVGGHRRYTGADVLRLDLACRLMRQGLAPAEAARVALASDIDLTPIDQIGPVLQDDDCPVAESLGAAPAAVRGLLRAAFGLDAPTCRNIVNATLERRGVVWTWDNLLVPALVDIGRRWQATGQGIETEHLLSAVIDSEMQAVVNSARATVNTRPVLLAAAPDDLHTLPLATIAAALAERHISTRMLGARTPIEALLTSIKRLGPAAVVVWSQLEETGGPEVLQAIPSGRSVPAIIAAGPGWSDTLPAGVERPVDLVDTVTRVTAAIR